MPTCTAANLATLSVGFTELTPKQREGIKIYLLALRAGASTDPAVLAGLARCYCGLSRRQMAQIQLYLLCQLAP